MKSKRRLILLALVMILLCARHSMPDRSSSSVGFRSMVPGIDLTILIVALAVLAQGLYHDATVKRTIGNSARIIGGFLLTIAAALPILDDITHIYPSYWCLLAAMEAVFLLFYMYKFTEQN